MANLTLGTSAIRERDGLFSLNDLHCASGGQPKHRPAYFVALEQTKALVAEIEQGRDSGFAMKVKHGGCNGSQTYACRELVIAYAAWISAAFHLKVIRVFLAASAPAQPSLLPAPIDAERIKLAHSLAAEVAAVASRTVFEAVLNGDQRWRHDRWMFGLSWDEQQQNWSRPWKPTRWWRP